MNTNPPRSRMNSPSQHFAELGGFRRVDRSRQQGFTLIEVILVIAIMVIVAALAVPAIQRLVKSQGIKSGAYRVRDAMGQARVRAIRTGEVHAVFYYPNGSWFDVSPLSNFQEIAGRRSNRESALQNGGASDTEEDLLPRDVTFVAGQTSSDSRSAASMADASATDSVQMVLFYPDGTSQDARVTLRNDIGDQWVIELRGLTGLAACMRQDPQTGAQ